MASFAEPGGREVNMRSRTACVFSVVFVTTFVGVAGSVAGSPSLAFRQSEQVFLPISTPFVALGDVDSDGDLDAVFANMQRNPSQIWLNDGTGHFVDSGQTLTPWGHGVGLGDLDGDGDLDLFITCAHYAYRSRVYLNDGAGTFVDSGQVLPDRASSGNGVQLADIDTDGDLDVLVVYYEEPDRVFVNDGTGRFTMTSTPLPENATPGDVDGDGDVDLLVKEIGVGYRVLRNDGTGAFADGPDLANPQVTDGGITLGDLDGDGDLDAVAANGDGSAEISTTLLVNDGDGGFTESSVKLGPAAWAHPALGDLNGDGALDVFVTNFGQPCEIWLNNGTGAFQNSLLRLAGAEASLGGELGDLDGDGDLDLLVACFSECANQVWFNVTPRD
jgi:hypothetical protein